MTPHITWGLVSVILIAAAFLLLSRWIDSKVASEETKAELKDLQKRLGDMSNQITALNNRTAGMKNQVFR